jgi:hypothetical protein
VIDTMKARARDAELTQLCREHWAALVRLAVLMLGDRASAEDAVKDPGTSSDTSTTEDDGHLGVGRYDKGTVRWLDGGEPSQSYAW